ncbi:MULTISPECIES: hypothetical protein [Pseudomonas]|jgi:hypothetical protein|uniref:Uncharacterized protein n=2 Tax=Pseudomonas TaxID=286 RepID=A0A7W2R2E2_9PSED|nr:MULTISPECIES: hypothetical protein [Pseudomonas]EGB96787.1 hypothetical protein G1E_21686 [Pseudomonas sp. TJI-51]ELU0815067.1 hypothetical protein [Pseudomonas putida]KAF0256830.1 hypothetical protein GN299_01390 [Pseudomonas putida]MBA6132117.1 hypothetical protein [Pseudomonas juntendi]MBA6150805.1 hypothetical protein [Pseudomonas juntendi]
MSDAIAVMPRKNLTPVEREFLKKGNRMMLDKPNGRMGSAALMDIVADWHGSRAVQGFEQYAKAWIIQGGAKSKAAHQLLCELFGLDTDPTPRRAA